MDKFDNYMMNIKYSKTFFTNITNDLKHYFCIRSLSLFQCSLSNV